MDVVVEFYIGTLPLLFRFVSVFENVVWNIQCNIQCGVKIYSDNSETIS
jgi:hypothetical protein